MRYYLLAIFHVIQIRRLSNQVDGLCLNSLQERILGNYINSSALRYLRETSNFMLKSAVTSRENCSGRHACKRLKVSCVYL